MLIKQVALSEIDGKLRLVLDQVENGGLGENDPRLLVDVELLEEGFVLHLKIALEFVQRLDLLLVAVLGLLRLVLQLERLALKSVDVLLRLLPIFSLVQHLLQVQLVLACLIHHLVVLLLAIVELLSLILVVVQRFQDFLHPRPVVLAVIVHKQIEGIIYFCADALGEVFVVLRQLQKKRAQVLVVDYQDIVLDLVLRNLLMELPCNLLDLLLKVLVQELELLQQLFDRFDVVRTLNHHLVEFLVVVVGHLKRVVHGKSEKLRASYLLLFAESLHPVGQCCTFPESFSLRASGSMGD